MGPDGREGRGTDIYLPNDDRCMSQDHRHKTRGNDLDIHVCKVMNYDYGY